MAKVSPLVFRFLFIFLFVTGLWAQISSFPAGTGGGGGTTISGLTENVISVGVAGGANVQDNAAGCTVTLAAGLVCGSTSAGRLRLNEASANGSNFRGILAPDSLSSDYDLVLPSADPAISFLRTAAPSSGAASMSWVGYASQAEAEAGTDADKLMTPERTAQAIAALSSGGGATYASGICSSALGAGQTNRYCAGTAGFASNELSNMWLVPKSGTASNLRIHCRDAQGADGDATFVLRVGATSASMADTAVTVTVAAGSAAGTYSSSGTASVTAGHIFGLKGSDVGGTNGSCTVGGFLYEIN